MPQHVFRNASGGPTYVRATLLFLLFLLIQGPQAYAQAPKPPAAPAPAPKPMPVPVADIAVQAENALLQARQLENRPLVDALVDESSDELASLTRGVSVKSAEMRRSLMQGASLDTIRNLEKEWREMERRASALTRELTRSALQLDRDIAETDRLEAQWEATRTAAAAENAPPAVLKRVDDVNTAVGRAKKRLLEHRTDVLGLQSRSANLAARASQSRDALNDAGERAVARLLRRDSPPLWSTGFWYSSIDSFSAEADANLAGQTSALSAYVAANRSGIVSHVFFFAAISAALYLVRRRLPALVQPDGCLQRTGKIFERPLVTGLLLALLASSWFYPRPPTTFWVILNMIGALPILVLVRHMIEPRFYPTLYALIGFFLADKLRVFAAPLPVLARVLFLVEILLFIGVVVWTLRRFRRRSEQEISTPGWSLTRLVGWITALLAAGAVAVNINGQSRLADLLGGAALTGAYAGVALYALVRVAQDLAQGMLSVSPISMLRMVRHNEIVITNRINRWIRKLAYIGWAALVLQSLSAVQPVVNFAQEAWKTALPIGAFSPTVGDIVLFVLIIWATLSLSRFSRFVLDEEIFPKLRLERGLPYAVSRVMHYLVLVLGFILALNALGVDMTKFTILAGAFSVGIGFGLQNIVNNFVSGLIVLFERPVKVGDTIQIDDVVGQVRHIGIRACVVASTTGAEVIIPNGKLISDKVTNWTLSGRVRQITVPVMTKAGINATEIRTLLIAIARKNELVADTPPPEALFVKRALDSFEFELRVWTAALDQWLEVRSELMTEINEALREREAAPQS